MDKVILIQEVDLGKILKPVSKSYFMECTGLKRNTVYNWIEEGKILIDKKTQKILATEIIRHQQVA